jgi:ABC-type branched-subunit amino acid transport system ATPase component
MLAPLLEIRNLTFEVGHQTILDRLDLMIDPNEIHALLGANGSGKTTLAYLLMGSDGYVPTAGRVLFEGADLLPLKMHERAQRGVTLAWQDPARFEGVTVREYLTLGRQDRDPESALAQVGLAPDRYLARRVDKSLSGGERHRIELASVLSMKPSLAILDEPAAGSWRFRLTDHPPGGGRPDCRSSVAALWGTYHFRRIAARGGRSFPRTDLCSLQRSSLWLLSLRRYEAPCRWWGQSQLSSMTPRSRMSSDMAIGS